MADTSNLSSFLGDVADAIRTKKGTTEAIPAANFDTEIASIETGSDISDATATANDILAGTTAYIADGKVEGNIQKEEETIGTMIGSNEILDTSDEYNFGPSSISTYCNRHNLAVVGVDSYPKVASLDNNFVYSQELVLYSDSYFGKTDNSDGTISVTSMSKGYFRGIDVDLKNKTCTVKHEGLYVPRLNEYDYFPFIPDATNQNRFYVLGKSSYTNLALYLVEGTSYTKLIDVNVGSETVLKSTVGYWAPYYVPMDYNPSNTKLLIQIRNAAGSNYRDFGLFIYDIASNSIEYKIWSNDSTFSYERCPFTWYDDNTLLNGNKIQKLENDNIIDIGTINNMSNVVSPKYAKRYNDTGLVLKVMDSSIVAQSIDFANNYVIDEKIILSKSTNCHPYIYDGGISITAANSSGANSYSSLYKIELTGEKIITKLVREGKSYIDTSKGTTTSGDILEGKIAYSNGNKLTGAMPNNGELNYTPSAEEQTIPGGYTSGGTVSGDSNLTASNIKLGVSIFGVEGNLEPDKPDQSKTATPTTEEQVITPDTGYELASVTVEAVTSDIDSNIVAENIKSGITILGVDGSFEGGTQLPDEVFIQEEVPTKTTDEAIWLKQSAADDTLFLDKLSDETLDTALSNGLTVRDDIARLPQEAKDIINNGTNHAMSFINSINQIWYFILEGDARVFLMDGDFVVGIPSGGSGSITTLYYSSSSSTGYYIETDTNTNTYHIVDTPLYDTVVYESDTSDVVIYQPNITYVETTEEGVNIVNGDIMTTVYINKGTDFEKILDTSNANATSSDILEGKTAFVNNEKLTGTYVPLDTSKITATALDVRSNKVFIDSNGTEIQGELVTQDSNSEISTTDVTLELIPPEGNIEGLNITEFTDVTQYYNNDSVCVQNIKLIAKSLVEKYGYHPYWYAYNFNDGKTGSSNSRLTYTVAMSDSEITQAGEGTGLSSGIQSNSSIYYRKVIFYQNNIYDDSYDVVEVDLFTGIATKMNPGMYDFAPTNSGGQVVHTNYEASFTGAAKIYNDMSIVWLENTPSAGIITNYISDRNIIVDSGTIIKKTLTNEQLLTVIGLTADKIKKGETILGITGTYEGDSPITQEEYDTALTTATDILGEEATE